MRKFVLLILVAIVLSIAVGAGIALGIHWSGLAHGMSVSIDGENFEGSMVAAGLGAAAAIGAVIVCVIVVTALASVAIIVPVALAVAAIAVVVALVVGLSPILIPVLLVVGAYALLSRRTKRRASAQASSVSMSPPIS